MNDKALTLINKAEAFGLLDGAVADMGAISEFIEKLKESSDKPNILLFASFEFGLDYITQHSKTLKKYFNLFKIFTNSISNDPQNENFKAIVSIKRDFGALSKILSDANYNISIVVNIGIYYHWYIPFFKAYSAKSLVCLDKDLTTTTTHCEDLESLKYSFDGSMERATFEQECENFMLENADGLLTSLGGDFFEQTVRQKVKRAFFYMPFRDKNSYVFKDKKTLNKNPRFCYAGTLSPLDYAAKLGKEGILYHVFKEFMASGAKITAYPTNGVAELLCYDDLAPNVTLREPIKADILVQEIADYDFGLVLNDFRLASSELAGQRDYIFPTKIFVYLAAGLPIIINKEYLAANKFLLERGVAVAICLDEITDIKNIVEKLDYATLKENVKKLQEVFSLQTYEDGLVKFLLEVEQS